MKKKRIVVTGMGVVSCFGMEVDHFYKCLIEGKSGVRLIDAFPCEDYPTRIAAQVADFDTGDYIDKKQARRVDPFIRYTMVAGKKALEYAGFSLDDLSSLDKKRCGIIVSSGMGGLNTFYDGVDTILTKGYKRLTPFFIPYIITNMGGGMLAIDLGFMGPNYSISTACATASNSIYAAAAHIENGEADLMICGGAEAPIAPPGLAGFVACKALSTRNDDPTKASRPWDKNRDGFVMGEGAGVLVLESYEHAKKRGATILAEYIGGGLSCDAYHITDPNPEGIMLCMENALRKAGIPKEKVDYINAHGTSTPVGDLSEIRAVKTFFGDHARNLKMNSTKSMTGHCLGAAGGIEAIATIMQIRHGQVHPTINVEEIEEEVAPVDIVPNHAKKCAIGVGMSNSLGFGGHNVSLLFSAFQE